MDPLYEPLLYLMPRFDRSEVCFALNGYWVTADMGVLSSTEVPSAVCVVLLVLQ
jgi:hypothetical protein